MLAVIQVGQGRSAWTWWTVFGISAGIGLLNKPSMAFFLLALGAGLLLTSQRRLLFTRQAACGIALLIVLASPNLLWQLHHHWPTLEFLHNGRVENKNVHLAPAAFLLHQFMTLGPWTALLWIPGLIRALRQPSLRWIGFTFLIFLAGMVTLGAKDYYVTPVYPILMAVGGIAWQTRFPSRTATEHGNARRYRPLVPVPFLVASFLMLLGCAQAFPLAEPVLRPATYVAYLHTLHQDPPNSENTVSGPLPQFYADRFGWQEEVNMVQRTVDSLSPQERAKAAILTDNYGEAGALEFLGHNLPPVFCGQNSYWMWGRDYLSTHPETGGQVLILVETTTAEHLHTFFGRVELVGTMNTTPWAMPYERRRKIWLLRDRKQFSLPAVWPEKKHYI